MQYFPVVYFLVGYPCWNEYVTNSAKQWKFQRYIHSRDTQLYAILGNYCATVNLSIHLNKELLNALGGFLCVCVSFRLSFMEVHRNKFVCRRKIVMARFCWCLWEGNRNIHISCWKLILSSRVIHSRPSTDIVWQRTFLQTRERNFLGSWGKLFGNN